MERLPRRPQPVASSSSSRQNAVESVFGGGPSTASTQPPSKFTFQSVGVSNLMVLPSAGNPGRDITITSNPLLLAAAAAASSAAAGGVVAGGNSNGIVGFGANNNIVLSSLQNQSHPTPNQINQSQFLLTRFMQPTLDDSDLAQLERSRAER